MNLITLLRSFLSTTIFCLIDGVLFLLTEKTLQKEFRKIPGFDDNMAELGAGGIAASIAIFITFYTYDMIQSRYHLIDHPLLDSLGVLIGMLIVLLGYYLYKRYKTDVMGEVVQMIHPMAENLKQKEDLTIHQFSLE
jgi:hypothetical protein